MTNTILHTEKEMRNYLRKRYKKSRDDKSIEINPWENVSDEEIEECINRDIEEWNKAFEEGRWGFRLCTGARMTFVEELKKEKEK